MVTYMPVLVSNVRTTFYVAENNSKMLTGSYKNNSEKRQKVTKIVQRRSGMRKYNTAESFWCLSTIVFFFF